MFVIVEWLGTNNSHHINLIAEENDGVKIFSTEQEAFNFAKENCAFNYRVIGLF